MIGINSSDIYALFYGALTYGKISIFLNFDNWVGAFEWILVFAHFLSVISTI